MPTLIINQPLDKESIEWKTFVIGASDSNEVKEKLMNQAVMAIEDRCFVAILGVQFEKDRFGQKIRKTATFLHRPSGDKRLSLGNSKSPKHSSSRKWRHIDNSHWDAFKQMVGTTVYSCKDIGKPLLLWH